MLKISSVFSFHRRHLVTGVTLGLMVSNGLAACAQNASQTTSGSTFSSTSGSTSARVTLARVPNGGLQPQVVVVGQNVHLVYYQGDPKAGDLFYLRSDDGGSTWSAPLRVNSQPGSAIAMGTIRGATLAVGRKGRVFVAWNGSDSAAPRNAATPPALQKFGAAPLLFTRLNGAGDGFEAQRNLMTRTFNLDGGACVAADGEGRVYLAWHANEQAGQDEAGRRVYLTTSGDDGATFSGEKPVWNTPTGACGCCQVGLEAQNGGRVSLLYRSATQQVNRDTYFLQSDDGGKSFRGQNLSQWNINICPMSRFSFAQAGKGRVIGWESAEKVYFSRLSETGQAAPSIVAPGEGNNRKYPSLALNAQGVALFAWTQGTSWGRGGSLRFQLFDAKSQPQGEIGGRDGVPAWSFATAFTRPDGSFTVLY